MLTDMMTTAVESGTGTNAKINGITVAGKTGTNDDYRSVYFAGMTGYYTASVWIGHDDYTPQLKSGATGGDYAAPLWQAFMSKIHEGLSDKAIIEDSPESLGLVKAKICRVSGKLATDACEHDALGLTPTTDWFLNGTVPTETCDMHIDADICNASGKLATEYCPSYQISKGSLLLVPKDSELASIGQEMVLKYLTHAKFSDLSVTQIRNLTPSDPDYYKYYCDVHNASSGGTYNWQYMYSQASSDVAYAQSYLISHSVQGTSYARITEAISQVSNAMNDAARDYNTLTAAVINLRNVFYSETGENIR
jgi:penicillin-binding protein 1A